MTKRTLILLREFTFICTTSSLPLHRTHVSADLRQEVYYTSILMVLTQLLILDVSCAISEPLLVFKRVKRLTGFDLKILIFMRSAV
jgi:hypothetical protein